MNHVLPEILTLGITIISAEFGANTATVFILTGIVYISMKMEQKHETI